jgi:hypothetical protein
MALPAAGNSISISQIRDELNPVHGSSYSLRQLSAWAGKGTPDAMSEFYGYTSTTTVDIAAYFPIFVGCGTYHTFAAVAATANVIDKVTQEGFGATYNFGIAKVAAMTTKLKFKDATAADTGDIKSNLLGVEVPVNAKVMVRASASTGEIKDNGTKTYDLDGYQLVAMYNLSKRSHLYGAIGQTKYDSPAADSDVKINQMGVGLRTTF